MQAPAPEPSYEPPRYAAPAQVYQAAQPPTPTAPPDPALLIVVLGGIAFVILLVVAAAAGERAAVDQLHTATDATRSEAQKADTLAAKATMTADEIDRYIAQQIAQAYERGRNSLEERRP